LSAKVGEKVLGLKVGPKGGEQMPRITRYKCHKSPQTVSQGAPSPLGPSLGREPLNGRPQASEAPNRVKTDLTSPPPAHLN